MWFEKCNNLNISVFFVFFLVIVGEFVNFVVYVFVSVILVVLFGVLSVILR